MNDFEYGGAGDYLDVRDDLSDQRSIMPSNKRGVIQN
jgi:hypothetical protein